MGILNLLTPLLRNFTIPVFFLICGSLMAENNQTQWSWHGAFPWVYSHLEKGWHYWHAGTDGNFYRWKDSNKTWYQYDQNLGKWSVVSSVGSASNSSSSDSTEKSEDDNWWEGFDKSDDSSKDNSTNSSAETLNLSLQHDGLTREYLLYVPSSYNSNTAVPLLFNFHGYGGTSSDHLSTADMRSLADQENFLLCYPQGSSDSYGSGHWNAALPGSDNKSTADDTGFAGSGFPSSMLPETEPMAAIFSLIDPPRK